jgi:hypothetical protein
MRFVRPVGTIVPFKGLFALQRDVARACDVFSIALIDAPKYRWGRRRGDE